MKERKGKKTEKDSHRLDGKLGRFVDGRVVGGAIHGLVTPCW